MIAPARVPGEPRAGALVRELRRSSTTVEQEPGRGLSVPVRRRAVPSRTAQSRRVFRKTWFV
jgi:hypothetical protein